MAFERGTVVKGPDLFADNPWRPYVDVTDGTHPFGDEEGGLYVAVTTTRTSKASKAGSLRGRPSGSREKPRRTSASTDPVPRNYGRNVIWAAFAYKGSSVNRRVRRLGSQPED